MPDRIRVVIVDDHTIVREGLRSILELEPDIEVVGHAATPAEALSTIAGAHPDVTLLDLKLTEEGPATGLDLCGSIAADFPDVAVVVLTTFHDQTLVLEAIRRGARGYVLKDVDVVDLVKIIRSVRNGSLMVHSVSEQDGRPRLTRRELEIVRLLARGMTNREIGRAALISDSTVKFHVRGIMRKLDVHHRTEVVYAATKLGIL
jgi:two-component system, NarL family, response regulator DevR